MYYRLHGIRNTNKKEIIVKLSNVSEENKEIRISLEGLNRRMKIQPEAQAILLKGEADKENTLDNPDAIVPVDSSVSVNGTVLQTTAEAGSFNVYRIAYTD